MESSSTAPPSRKTASALLADLPAPIAAYLRSDPGWTQATVDAYAFELLALATHFGEARFLQATNIQLQEYFMLLHKRGVRQAGVRRATVVIRAFYRWAAADAQLVQANPAAHLVLPKHLAREFETLGPAKADTLFKAGAPANLKESLRDQALLSLFYDLGLTVSEVIGLGLANYDKPNEELMVIGRKGQSRSLPVPERTARLLTQYLAQGRPGYVRPGLTHDALFLTRLGKPMSPSGLWRHVQTLTAALEGAHAGVSPAGLRRAAAVMKRQAGASTQEVLSQLGLKVPGYTVK